MPRTGFTESLLEMHFHRPLLNLFEAHFGRQFLRILKPSTSREVLLGFDQGWVHTELPLTDFRDQLQAQIAAGASAHERRFVGYFLQFKTVERLSKGKYKPESFDSPYLRSELDVVPNDNVGRSQHETLLRLQSLVGCDVNYACPMILDEDQLYAPPDLDDLRVVPISGSPKNLTQDERHFICFRNTRDDAPLWCSEPVEGRSFSATTWVSAERAHRRDTAKTLASLLDSLGAESLDRMRGDPRGVLPSCMTIVEFESGSVRR